MHKPNALVTPFKKMSRSKFAPPHIIYSDRANVLDTARSVEQNNGNTALSKSLQVTGIALHRSNQYPLSALLLEDVQVVIFLFDRVVGVTQNDDIASLISQVLSTTSDLGEKGIGHIEYDQADVLTGASA